MCVCVCVCMSVSFTLIFFLPLFPSIYVSFSTHTHIYIYIYIYIYVCMCVCVCVWKERHRKDTHTHTHTHTLYIYIYIYILGAFNKFPGLFLIQAFKIVVDSWNLTMLLLYILWNDWQILKISGSNATAAIGIHPKKPWLSQLANFKNAIWTWGHFRRTICNKILF